MIYGDIREGLFRSRPNRFIAHVDRDAKTEICHVKNTGRCKELLVPGAKVYLNRSANPARKTQYDLIAVYKGNRLINIDSQAPNKVFLEHLRSGRYMDNITLIKPEASYGSSRFDFYLETGGCPETGRFFIEVKGVTLEEKGVALFPDAPTQRGIKHLNELAACTREGFSAHIIFIVQMSGVKYFTPNSTAHPAFAEALAAASAAGVTVTALECGVAPDRLEIRNAVPVMLP